MINQQCLLDFLRIGSYLSDPDLLHFTAINIGFEFKGLNDPPPPLDIYQEKLLNRTMRRCCR